MTTLPPSTSSTPPTTPQPSPKRKKSLENDLRQLLHDERFFDISLKCSDNVILRACKNILAIRTKVFNENISKESLEFDKINSIAMKFILEYLYTSKNVQEVLNVDNIVEIYYSAIYFKLDDLQKDLIEFTIQTLREGNEDLGKRLLSECIEKFTLQVDNEMSNLLVDWVAKIQLVPNDASNDSLSLMGLQHLLVKTYNTKKSFATYELTLFEYTLIKTKQIILENIDSELNPYEMNYEASVIERIKNRLTPLLPYIDLCIIDSDDVVRIEQLNIFSQDMITSAYRFRIRTSSEVLQPNRGQLIFKWKNFDDESWQSKNKLRITDNGFTVKADSDLKTYKSVMGNLVVKGNGIHKWDILVEKLNETIYIGISICGINEKFGKPGDQGFHGWALGSDGYVYNENTYHRYNTRFIEGDVVNICVNTNTKQCFFSVNGVTNYEVIGHSFPEEVYPFVSLSKDSKLHIKSD